MMSLTNNNQTKTADRAYDCMVHASQWLCEQRVGAPDQPDNAPLKPKKTDDRTYSRDRRTDILGYCRYICRQTLSAQVSRHVSCPVLTDLVNQNSGIIDQYQLLDMPNEIVICRGVRGAIATFRGTYPLGYPAPRPHPNRLCFSPRAPARTRPTITTTGSFRPPSSLTQVRICPQTASG